jgi:hypothetical protein
MNGSLHIVRPDRPISRIDTTDPQNILELIKPALNGGYVEAVPSFYVYEGQQCVAFCDEDGKNKKLPFNAQATLLWARALDRQPSEIGDYLVGTVIIVTGDAEFMEGL